MEHTHCKPAYITLKCASVFLWQFNWVEHTTEPLEIISDPTTPLNNLWGQWVPWDFLKIWIFLLSIWLEWKQKPVGVVWFRNREITRGQGFCVTCTRLPQDFLHTSTSPLGTGRRDFFFLVRIRAVGNAALSTCGFPQGRSVCVCVCVLMSYDLHFP